jgi:hypothetical protein
MWCKPSSKKTDEIPDGLKRELYKTFEKYGIDDDKAMACLWKNKTLSCAMRGIAREHELIDRLKDWLA